MFRPSKKLSQIFFHYWRVHKFRKARKRATPGGNSNARKKFQKAIVITRHCYKTHFLDFLYDYRKWVMYTYGGTLTLFFIKKKP